MAHQIDDKKLITFRDNGSVKVTTVIETPSKTDQQFKDDCDINSIIAKFKKTGQINHLNKKTGVYADVSNLPDLMTAGQQIREAEESFNALPAQVRKKFRNNPEEMIEFLRDPENRQEAEKLGLITPQPKVYQQPNDNPNDEQPKKDTKTDKKASKPASNPDLDSKN